MKNRFHYYITKHIRAYYRRRLATPLVYLAFLSMLNFILPISSMLSPDHVGSTFDVDRAYAAGSRYVTITLDELYFTGYTKEWLGSTVGYYYYTNISDDCVIVLLNPSTCQQGLSTMSDITIRACILKESHAMDSLVENLAADLTWTVDGVAATLSTYMLSQPDATGPATLLLLLVYVVTGLIAAIMALHSLVCLAFPSISTPCLRLWHYGIPWRVLRQAEEELSTLPQLATEDMFITEHFFIETSPYGVAIVPISEMLWIYKYSTLHKFMWHIFGISYTLHITSYGHRYLQCPQNTKSDIDGIIDYLAEANHDILVGFSEENRIKEAQLRAEHSALRQVLKQVKELLNKKV